MLSDNNFQSIIDYLRISDDFVADTEKLREYSEKIGEYYYMLYETSGDPLLYSVSQNVMNCNDLWFFDYHPNFQVMDNTHINLCHNRYCPNCAKVKQATLLYKFSPYLEKAAETCDLFHLTLSVPNVSAADLKDAVKNLLESFARLMRLMFGSQTIKGIDFKRFGCRAACRSLEITYSNTRMKKAEEYHPHIHCILALDKKCVQNNSDFLLIKKHTNTYSYDYIDGKRIFKQNYSDFEVLIQQLWKLVYDNIVDKNRRQKETNKKLRQIQNFFIKDFKPIELDFRQSIETGFSTAAEIIRGKKTPKVKSKYISAKDVEIGRAHV